MCVRLSIKLKPSLRNLFSFQLSAYVMEVISIDYKILRIQFLYSQRTIVTFTAPWLSRRKVFLCVKPWKVSPNVFFIVQIIGYLFILIYYAFISYFWIILLSVYSFICLFI